MIPVLDLKAPHVELCDEINEAIARVVGSGWYILCSEVEAFEVEYAAYCEASHCDLAGKLLIEGEAGLLRQELSSGGSSTVVSTL